MKHVKFGHLLGDAPVATSAPKREIFGYVLDEARNPVEGATAVIYGDRIEYKGVTDGSGRFTIQDAPFGPVTLVVLAPGRPLINLLVPAPPETGPVVSNVPARTQVSVTVATVAKPATGWDLVAKVLPRSAVPLWLKVLGIGAVAFGGYMLITRKK